MGTLKQLATGLSQGHTMGKADTFSSDDLHLFPLIEGPTPEAASTPLLLWISPGMNFNFHSLLAGRHSEL